MEVSFRILAHMLLPRNIFSHLLYHAVILSLIFHLTFIFHLRKKIMEVNVKICIYLFVAYKHAYNLNVMLSLAQSLRKRLMEPSFNFDGLV